MDEKDLAFASVSELGRLLAEKKISSVELTQLALKRLDGAGRSLNAVATLLTESALAEARKADEERAAGKVRGPLHGIPYGAKDLLDTKGVATTWGSIAFKDRVPVTDATAVARLRDAGAVLVAKLAMIELAGGAGYRFASASLQGATRTPWSGKHWSGGSSSGSGAAVGSGCVPFAIGSETWGSIVCPSTFCGVSGLRPTYGRVSRKGAMSLCPTLDKLGPLARTAEDCGAILAALAGPDPEDPSALPSWRYEPIARPIRVGVLPDKSWDGYQPEAVTRAHDALALLEKKGHTLVPVALPDFPFDAVLVTILSAEASAMFEPLIRSGKHMDLIDPLSKTGLLAGLTIPAVDYVNAMRRRSIAGREMARLFETIDVLAGPTFPSSATPIDANLETWFSLPTDPLHAPGNLCGLPAAAVPCDLDKSALPLSVCFMAAAGAESKALAAATAYQRETSFHKNRPPIS